MAWSVIATPLIVVAWSVIATLLIFVAWSMIATPLHLVIALAPQAIPSFRLRNFPTSDSRFFHTVEVSVENHDEARFT